MRAQEPKNSLKVFLIMSELYLHERRDFADLIKVVAKNQKIDPSLIEKDYWLMHCLYGLQQAGYDFQLKGGTSLSKGFGIIERFSEDIDIQITPPKGMKVRTSKNHDKGKDRQGRKAYYDYLAQTIKIDGIDKIERDTLFDSTPKYFSGGIRLSYPAQFPSNGSTKEGILLEVGFDDITPNHLVDISSWALDFALSQNMPVKDNKAYGVPCYDPGYTLVEKLQTIATKFRLQQKNGGFPENFMRHYYDVSRLLSQQVVLDFIGTKDYQAHKEKRFPKDDLAVPLSKNEAFLLSDSEIRDLYKREYEKRRGLYYRGQPRFEDILRIIRDNLDRM